MAEKRPAQASPHRFQEVETAGTASQNLVLEDLRRVHLTLTFDLGEARMLVHDILALKPGSIVPLNKMAGELTDIRTNGRPLGKGEVVVIGDALHVRVAEIEGAQDQIDELHQNE